MENHATEVIQEIYREGDVDLIFFGQLLGFVSGEGDRFYNKTPERRIADAIKLVSFLVSSGDFFAGRTERQGDGTYSDLPFPGGMNEFAKLVTETFNQKGIDDISLLVGSWIKKNRPGQAAPEITEKILDLFRDCGPRERTG